MKLPVVFWSQKRSLATYLYMPTQHVAQVLTACQESMFGDCIENHWSGHGKSTFIKCMVISYHGICALP